MVFIAFTDFYQRETIVGNIQTTNVAGFPDIFYLNSGKAFVESSLETFERIKQLFIYPRKIDDTTVPGEAINFLDQRMLKDTMDFFADTKRLNAKQYYLDKLPSSKLATGLFISPFEGKMRDFLYNFIDSANDFIYFFLETFFDEELVGKLQEKASKTPNILIKILTSPPERIRQSPQKARELINQGLSLGMDIGYLTNIQAKFWVSDKWIAIPSGDFNRMNLGHQTSKHYWKADTQLLLLEDDPDQIIRMKDLFEQKFKSIDRGSTCLRDVDKILRRMAKHSNLAGSKDASKYLARFKSTLMIKTEQDVRLVIGFAVKLTELDNKKRVDGVHMLMAIILFNLQRREHRLKEIDENLENIGTETEMKNAIDSLERKGLVIRSGDVYRINPNLGDLKTTTQKSIHEF